MRRPALRRARGGFTLAEVAVTLIIVGITLLWILEGLNNAKMTAAHTHHQKIASELGMETLAQIEAGLFWEDLDVGDDLNGTYADEGYEAFSWEVVLGDETFDDLPEPDDDVHDSFLERQRREDEAREEEGLDDEDEEEIEEPYEKVRVRVHFPKLTEVKSEIILERWVPWEQVYGPSEEDQAAEEAGDQN